jgi:hypothetical protein
MNISGKRRFSGDDGGGGVKNKIWAVLLLQEDVLQSS